MNVPEPAQDVPSFRLVFSISSLQFFFVVTELLSRKQTVVAKHWNFVFCIWRSVLNKRMGHDEEARDDPADDEKALPWKLPRFNQFLYIFSALSHVFLCLAQSAFTEARNDPADDEEARDDPAFDEEALPRKRFSAFRESASDATHPAVFAACWINRVPFVVWQSSGDLPPPIIANIGQYS